MIDQIRQAARFGFDDGVLDRVRPDQRPLRRVSSFFAIGTALSAVFLVASTAIFPVLAQVTGQGEIGVSDAVIADPNSAVALFGYDPVAYFIDERAAMGLPAINLIEFGLVWRFVNEGNRDAFKADPAAYIPAYGGYDPLDVSRERLVAGRPEIFAVIDGKLMLFRNDEARVRFIADDALRAEAAKKWPGVSRGLSRTKR